MARDDAHVYPVGDNTPVHVISPTCWCQPQRDYVDAVTGGAVWLHRRYFDGRAKEPDPDIRTHTHFHEHDGVLGRHAHSHQDGDHLTDHVHSNLAAAPAEVS